MDVVIGDPMLSDSSNEADHDDDENSNNWQQAPAKRKRTLSPNIFQQQQQQQQLKRNAAAPSTSNRFDVLRTDDKTEDNNENTLSPPKPPPIFIPDVSNIGKMVNNLSALINSAEFNYKSLRDGQIRLSVKTVESYRKVIKHFDTEKIKYHTFQVKNERAFRVVIKGLHHSTSLSDIKAMLLSLGHQVRSVRNVVSRVTKMPLPMFFVDLDPSENNNDIFNIHSFDRAIIQVEAPKKFDDIVQCFRCQDYGHTKSYCRKEFRCVKCGVGHPTNECKKARDVPPKCVHCQGIHTANYKGCILYKKLIDKRYSRGTNNANQSEFQNFNSHPSAHQNNIPKFQEGFSYAQAARGDQSRDISILEKIEETLAKQIELTNTLINMMSMLMSKLCK